MNDASVEEKAPSARAELKVILDHFGAYKKDFVMSGVCRVPTRISDSCTHGSNC